ncbi:hypothetical protein GCM10010971_40140 [Silvimonas amylolytica]|uniref:Amino acid transport protein n=2 Tax=Silvimonas amylolytica TaxID=449663 RepID=A0ABQ2PRU2_9NEIS|nr:hypothetical protein GCM10010971_40140 [Silvimonas amylolytica]
MQSASEPDTDGTDMQLPTPANLFASVFFSIVGFTALRYGKKRGLRVPIVVGIALMIYPYFISQTWLLYLIGLALCVGMFVVRA